MQFTCLFTGKVHTMCLVTRMHFVHMCVVMFTNTELNWSIHLATEMNKDLHTMATTGPQEQTF